MSIPPPTETTLKKAPRRPRGRGRNRPNRNKGANSGQNPGKEANTTQRSGGRNKKFPPLPEFPVLMPSTPLSVDIGVNFVHKSLKPNLQCLLQRARTAGVGAVIITGTNLKASANGVRMAKEYVESSGDGTDGASSVALYCTVGCHPHDSSSWTEKSEGSMRKLLANDIVVAVGECGLDYDRMFSSEEEQERAFRAQLQLAVEVQKPVFLHERDASGPFLRILSQYWPSLAGGVVHCFSSSGPEALDAYIALGAYIGITGWVCDDKRGAELQSIVSRIPLDRILIETDAPFLKPKRRPVPSSGRNEPAYLPFVAETLAECMGVSLDALITASTANAVALFGITVPT